MVKHPENTAQECPNPIAIRVMEYFKGVRATGRALGRTPSTVSKWKKTGIPPEKNLYLKLKELGAPVTAEEILTGTPA